MNHANINEKKKKKKKKKQLINTKVEFRAKNIIRNKEGHFLTTKWSILNTKGVKKNVH